MGCDGGTIPTRGELVKLKKKPEQKDKDAARAALWKSCAITQEPLRKPIVACELGRLYNKESILELLLDRSKCEGASKFDHIRGLKDVKQLKFSENPAFKEKSEMGDGYIDRCVSEYICPITGLEMSGKYKFCYYHGCACVVSQRAIKEVKTDTCNTCGAAVQLADIILLNGSEEEMTQMRANMQMRRLKAKADKKQKTKHKLESTANSLETTDDLPTTSKQAKVETTSKSSVSKIHASSSKLTNGSTGTSKLTNGKPKTIQEDPRASKAYKSLFNTCDKAKNQPKPHWITHNPCFY